MAETYSEGNIVRYTTECGQDDTARVRRVYADSLQLVNGEHGYQLISLDQVHEVVGEVAPKHYGGSR